MIKQFAVIGNPIEHSRSPELHHAFASKVGIQLHYKKLLASLNGFERSVVDFFSKGGTGLNVTVPFKEQAYELCDVLTERAKIAKAVNTLWKKDGLLHGDNTDGQGLVNAVLALGWPIKDTKILILGAGGATRGIIYPLFEAGVQQIVIANRTLARAKRLIDDFKNTSLTHQLRAIDLSKLEGKFDLVINATSTSLTGDALVLPDDLKFNYAYEMAYGKSSSFINQTKARNIPVSEGFGMLVGQAIESFFIWHDIKPNLKDFL